MTGQHSRAGIPALRIRLSLLLIAPPLVGLMALLAAGPTGGAMASPTQPTRAEQPEIRQTGAKRIAGVSITVSDLDEAVAWYTGVVGATLHSTGELAGEPFERTMGLFGARARVARLSIGHEQIELAEYLTPAGRPIPPDSRSNDAWFQHIAIIVRDMDEAFTHLRRQGVDFASVAPQRIPEWNAAASGIEAFYFRDPDGHFLEILAFPPDKGEERWQDNHSLFLGIDHTAIVVKDTDRAIAFYRDGLGLRVAGESENFGPEQEHLNAVYGARLRITALRATEGPAIELLEYLTPRTGRPTPIDTAPSDLWHWHTLVEVADTEPFFASLRKAGGSGVSPGTQRLEWDSGGADLPHLLVRDPDGHALLLRGVAD